MLGPGNTFAPSTIGPWIHASLDEEHVRCDDEETADEIPWHDKALQVPLSYEESVVVEVGQELLVYDPFACFDDGLNCVTRKGSMAKLLLCWLEGLIACELISELPHRYDTGGT